MGVGEILDGAFKLYRANFKPIALVALILSAPLQIITSIAVRGQNGGTGLIAIFNDPSLGSSVDSNPFQSLGANLTLVLTTFVGFLVGPLIAGAVAKAVATSYLGGEISTGEALRASLRCWWPLLAGSILVHLVEGVSLLGCCIGLLFVMPLWMVVSPAIVVEGLGPVQGMKRSFQLCTTRYWPVLGIALLSGLITQTLGGMVGGVPAIAAGLIGYRWGFPLLALGGVATAVFVGPISAIVATLVYFDLRIRREGFDLEVMAANTSAHGAR